MFRRILSIFIFVVLSIAPSIAQESGSVSRQLEELSRNFISAYQRLEMAKYRNTIAVANFENRSPLAEQQNLGYAFSELLTSYLIKNVKIFRVIERKQLDKILSELEFSLSDLASQDNMLKMGEMSGANLLVLGSVFEVDNDVQVEVKLVETEKAEVLLSETIRIPKQSFVEATQYLIEMRNTIGVDYSWQFLPDFNVSRIGVNYAYSFSKGLSLTLELFGGIGHEKHRTVKETYSAMTTYWNLDSVAQELGLGLYLGAKFPNLSAFAVAWHLGPLVVSYLDTTELASVSDLSIISSEPFSGMFLMFGIRGGVALEFHLTKNIDLVAGGWYEYFPDNVVSKKIYWSRSPPMPDTNLTYNDVLLFSGAAAMVGLKYNF